MRSFFYAFCPAAMRKLRGIIITFVCFYIMNYILFDSLSRPRLLPFTHTRPVADIRCGILTMRERWELLLQRPSCTLTEDYMQSVFHSCGGDDNFYINGSVFGTEELMSAVKALAPGERLVSNGLTIAVRTGESDFTISSFHAFADSVAARSFDETIYSLNNVWDIFSLNDHATRYDFGLVTKDRTSASVPDGVTVAGKENLFIEAGANIYAGTIINATTGPVYIGKDVEILEGTLIRGPLAACEHAVIKMGAKMYGATTIGPGCKVGGEINNAVFFANSNKSHDGYLGNAVIGEWCNLGADTNCSNLKNNYDEVKIWSETEGHLVPTGLTFCGLIMGDHSKCGINTMFNTGTVVAVSCNIYGGGFPAKFIPSFSWGGNESMVDYDFEKAIATANRMMSRRGKKLTDAEVDMYRYVFEHSSKA